MTREASARRVSCQPHPRVLAPGRPWQCLFGPGFFKIQQLLPVVSVKVRHDRLTCLACCCACCAQAEKFARNGSPPKRPSIGPLLTPRAFSGKGGATLLNSSGGLRDALQRAGSHKVDARAGHAERDLAAASPGGLGRTIAALERAAADAEQSRGRLAPAGPGLQPRLRPALPRLDVEAAAAQAAAEAAEESSSAGTAVQANGWSADDSSPSPLSSPTTSSMASPSPERYASSSAASSPERRRGASPSRRPLPRQLSPSRIDNPLWSQSPVYQGPPSRGAVTPLPADAWPPVGRHGPQPAAVPASASHKPSGLAPGAAHVPADRANPARGANMRSSFEGVGGGDGGLLESLLLPPALKPSHTQLLGALMHTAAPPARREEREERQAQLPEHGEEPEAEAAGSVAPKAAPAEAANESPTSPLEAAPSEPPIAAAEAADAAPAGTNRGGAGSGARRLAVALLTAVAGVAVASVAGVMQQGRCSSDRGSSGSARRRLPVLHPQPVPSMRDAQRRTHSPREEVEEQRKASRGNAGSRQPTASARWDSVHVELTKG